MEHEHTTYVVIYGIASANYPAKRVTAAKQLATAVKKAVLLARAAGRAVIVMGDLNAALSPLDRKGGGLLD